MAALTNDLTRQIKLGGAEGEKTIHLPLQGFTAHGSAYTVFKGAILASHAAEDIGFFNPNALAAANTSVFGGIAMGRQVVGPDAPLDGALEVNALIEGVVGFPVASFTQADVGKDVFANDTDNDLTLAPLLVLWIGTIEEVRDGQVWVNIEPAAMQLSVPTTLV